MAFLATVLAGCAGSREAARTGGEYPYVDAKYRACWESGYTEDEAKQLTETLPYTEITFERYACYGSCPVFKATLTSDGRVRYIGKRFVAHIGTYSGAGYLLDYGKLCYFIDKNDVLGMKDEYTVLATDLPGSRITITERSGRVKSIYDYGNCGPLELWMLQQALDQYLSAIEFERISDDTDGASDEGP